MLGDTTKPTAGTVMKPRLTSFGGPEQKKWWWWWWDEAEMSARSYMPEVRLVFPFRGRCIRSRLVRLPGVLSAFSAGDGTRGWLPLALVLALLRDVAPVDCVVLRGR